MFRILLFFLLFVFSNSFAQQVNWISFDKLNEKMRTQPRPVLVFIHTNWCKFCALQEEKTFTDSVTARKINNGFYAISLDAEQKSEIIFLNKRYRYKPSGSGTGHHELAEALGKQNGMLSFPTTVILSPSLQLSNRITGFINSTYLCDLLERQMASY